MPSQAHIHKTGPSLWDSPYLLVVLHLGWRELSRKAISQSKPRKQQRREARQPLLG